MLEKSGIPHVLALKSPSFALRLFPLEHLEHCELLPNISHAQSMTLLE